MSASTRVPNLAYATGGDGLADSLKALTSKHLRRFKRYSVYKDSGIEWLGEIPTHWEVRRLRSTITSCQNGVWGDEPDGNHDVLCVRVADFDRVRFQVQNDFSTLRSIESGVSAARGLHAGDLLLEKSGGGENQLVGAVVQYDCKSVAVCSNFVARITIAAGFDSRFLTYLHAALYALRINVRHIKQSTGIQNLDSSTYLNEKVALPSEAEQRAIAKLLDRETQKIDVLMAKKERLIELLQEQRITLITCAVTKGLDPNVQMKDSNVAWLGEIPEHWAVKPLKVVSSLQTGLTLGKDYDLSSTVSRPYLRVANVQDGYLALEDVTEVALPASDASRYELRVGDVLMTEGGDFDKLGRGHIWEGQIPRCLHQNHIFAVRPTRELLNPRYLALVMGSGYGRAYFTATSKQSTNLASTNSTKLRNLPMPMPDMGEQKQIVTELRREMSRIDGLIANVRMAIDKARELRIALISAAVTGKIDVREETA